MSKKVVHLADEAHELAKEHCRNTGIKMSDWVAQLIREAVLGKKQPTGQHYGQQHGQQYGQQHGQQHGQQYAQQPAPPYAQQHAPQHAPAHSHAHTPSRAPMQAHTSPSRQAAAQELSDAARTRGSGPKKKPMPRAEVTPQHGDDGVPVYAQPPFWSRAKG